MTPCDTYNAEFGNVLARSAPLNVACDQRWYAVYTSANHERSVASHLAVRSVEHFLPTYSSVRRWKDRKVMLKLPLFPGYVFVRLALNDRLRILQVPGVACIVAFGGRPAPIPEHEFASIHGLINKGLRAEPHPFLTAGRRVIVRSGPLQGMKGVIVRRKNSSRLVISMELIRQAIAVDLDSAEVEALR